MRIKRKQIYNPQSIETASERRIFGGSPTSLFDLNRIRYDWAYKLWKIMLTNTWFPEEVSMNDDKGHYHNRLTYQEKNSYDKALAQLIFMDSIQTNNLIDNINPYVTAPEINLVLVRQAFEEALHSQSYAVMVDSISADADAIYEMWRHDKILKSKNDQIAGDYITLSNHVDEQTMLKALYANQILEGIYFYTGFAYFYTLAINGKMLGSSTMIKFIHRDEVTHLLIFQNMINTLKKERPDLFTPTLQEELMEMFRRATELEIAWGTYITDGQVLGLSEEAIIKYVHYLCNLRLKAVKLPLLYEDIDHPLPSLKNFAIFNNQRTNFFEGKVTNYAKGAIKFDDF